MHWLHTISGCLCTGLLAVAMGADQAPTTPAAKKEAAVTSKRQAPAGRLPNGYGRLGLSDEQKTKVYEIQKSYDGRIQEIEVQLENLLTQRNAEVEAILTDAQKAQLKTLLAEGRRKAAEKRAQAKAATTTKSE